MSYTKIYEDLQNIEVKESCLNSYENLLRYVKEESIKEIMGSIKLKSNKKAALNRFLKYRSCMSDTEICILEDSIYLYNGIGIINFYNLTWKEYLEHYKELQRISLSTEGILEKMEVLLSDVESSHVYPFKLPDTSEVVQASKVSGKVGYNGVYFQSRFLADLLVLLEDMDLAAFSIDPTSGMYVRSPILIKSSKGRAILCPLRVSEGSRK